jgi:diguanylate cyclase (GGDEF)-like protein
MGLVETNDPRQRAMLLMCRTELNSNQWQTRAVLFDALAAMELFEEVGELGRALDAASLGAGFASRLGELSLATELATKCITGVVGLDDDAVLTEVANRLGIFCYSFLDYDRAVEQFEVALGAAENIGDSWKVARQLHNIADAVLVAMRQDRASGEDDGRLDRYGGDRLEQAERAVGRLVAECSLDVQRQLGAQRLQAEVLVEQGRPQEALVVLAGAQGSQEAIVWAAGQAALALVEARCRRALGQPALAVEAARRAVKLAEPSDDDHETMLILDELVGAEAEAGELKAALDHAVALKRSMWAIHRRQTSQVVEQVWARAALEHERTALEAQTAAAIRSAEEDALTRIGNRRLLERVMPDMVGPSPRIALLMADIDHFKLINDTFGHEVGDHVLRALGHILAGDARTGQVVVRYGGEEFVFALPGVELDAARDFAERIRVKVNAYPWEALETRLEVTVSIGVACGRSGNWRSVLASADRALYLAKSRGRNRVEVAPRGARRTA